MDTLVYVLIGVAVLVVLYVLFGRKKADEALPEAGRSDGAQPDAARAKALAEPKPKQTPKAEEPSPKAQPKAAAKEPARPQDAKTTREPAIAAKEALDAREAKAAADKAASEPPPKDAARSEPPAAPAKRVAQAASPKRAKDVAGLRKGLAKARESEGFFGRLKALFVGRKEIDPQIVEQMEEILLTSDVGVKTTAALVDTIREELSKGELKDEGRVWDALRQKTQEILEVGDERQGGIALSDTPTVVMVVGVNGVGKTTTIGKLATRLTQQGKKVVLAAGDTFRAAAVQQLVVWGKRAGCEVVTGAEGANAGAVIFDAIQKAKEVGADVVLADTAGRLHTKTNLMEELKKIAKTMNKAMNGAPHETLLVLDATNGQNATQQAALFKEALPLSGIVLTKLDGTAKGGVILSICAEHKVPVRYIGVGERAEDLRDFQVDEFVEALLGNNTDATDRAA